MSTPGNLETKAQRIKDQDEPETKKIKVECTKRRQVSLPRNKLKNRHNSTEHKTKLVEKKNREGIANTMCTQI